MFVLGFARTGLIFTRIQEGTQPGQTEQGIPYHVPSCRVLAGGELGGGNSVVARECAAAAVHESCSLRSVFVLCILVIGIVVVTVLFVCCSVKLPLSRPTRFLPVSFHSPPHPGRRRGCRVVLLLPAATEL